MSSIHRTLLLITASSPEIRKVRRARVLNFQQITMPYLAAFVPAHWDVVHVDETVSSIDVTSRVDLVGITFHTPSAFHAYDLATEFRRRGIPVAFGGPHVTLLPDEAQEYADVIFVGEAESQWPQFLRDFEAGHYARRYSSGAPPALDGAPMARKDLFTGTTIRVGGYSPHAAVPTDVISARWPYCINAKFASVPWQPQRRSSPLFEERS